MRSSVVLALVVLVGVASASRVFSEEEYQMLFTRFIGAHNKNYEVSSFFERFNTFKDNVDFIHRHNVNAQANGDSYTLAVNQFADMTAAEFKAKHLGYKMVARKNMLDMTAPVNVSNLATSVDWRTKGAVTPVKDQGQCGSCWAFSTVGAVEGLNQIKTGSLLSFSEQQLVDCAGGSYGNQGCNGGLMDYGFNYVKDKGLCTESAYPYKAVDGSCAASKCSAAIPAGFVTKYTDVATNDAALQSALNSQPVSVAIEADTQVFQFYSGGVITSKSCGTNLDHGVLAVGYNTDSATAYYIVKNSWGSSWGVSGYVNIGTGNICGINLSASYPGH